MATGYGAGLFDKSGPEEFGKAVSKISDALTGVTTSFTTFGSQAQSAIAGIAAAVSDLTTKLSGLQSQLKTAAGAGGGGGGGGGRRGMGPSAPPPGNGNLGPNGTNLTSNGPLWVPPSAQDPNGTFASGAPSMDPGSASRVNPGSQTPQPMDANVNDANAKRTQTQTPNQGGGGQGGFNWGPLVSGAAGSAAQFLGPQGYGGGMISTSVQGATIGQMLGPAFGVNPRSLYVIPGGTLSQNAGDYAQANYYAMMNMGVAPGTNNWSTVQRGANQLMTLVPGMSRQGAMQAQNMLQQPGVINRALAVGLNLRPGGQLQTPEQQYQQIFNRLTMGGQVNAKTFAAMMQPGAPGAVNLEAIGISPGSDAYYGFMQYAYTRLGQQAKGANMPDVGTSKGAKQAGLDTPYYAQLQAQSAKSQLESRAEPGIAEAAKNLNDAAAALLRLASPLGSGIGSLIGGLSSPLKMFGGGMGGGIGGFLKSLIGGVFQTGGIVPGMANDPMLAIVHGGERILTPAMGGIGNMLGGLNPMHMMGGLLGGIGGIFKHLFGGLFGGGGGSCGGGGGGGGGGLLGGLFGGGIGGLLGHLFGGGGGGGGGGGFHMPNIGGFFGRIGGDITGFPRHILGDVTGFGNRMVGDVTGFGRRVAGDVVSIPRHVLDDVLGFGSRVGHDVMGGIHRGLGFGKDILKEIPGLGELFGGSIFGAGGGLVHGAMHKAGGLFHSAMHGIGGLFKGAEHLGSGLLGGLGSALGKGKDFVSSLLMGKLSDIKDTALGELLSPAPEGSVLASITAKGAAPAAPHPVLTSQQQAPAPKQHAPMPQKTTHHKGGILGGIEGFLGSVGGSILGGLRGLGSDYAQFFGGTPAAAATTTGGPTGATGPATGPSGYVWSYNRPTANIADYSGMFATPSSASANSQTSSGGSSPAAGGSGGTGAGTPTNLTGSGNAQQAYNFFIGKGLKDYMAAGIVGNMAQESGVQPNQSQIGGGGGYGVVQWTPPTALQAWAKANNRDVTSLSTQLDFLWYQLNSTEKGALAMLQQSTDASSAAQAFEQGFERAGIPAMANRIKYAQNVLASKGASYARGSQYIARSQLALLHRGEAVVPAADNYSAIPYNRGGAAGSGGGPIVHLNFKQGAIVLQVPATSSQKDMENIANQFIAAVSKPQVLAALRSS